MCVRGWHAAAVQVRWRRVTALAANKVAPPLFQAALQFTFPGSLTSTFKLLRCEVGPSNYFGDEVEPDQQRKLSLCVPPKRVDRVQS